MKQKIQKKPEIFQANAELGYNAEAVEQMIRKDKRIKGKEARMIHALLKGRY